jgi:hypothetical protein
MTYCRRSIESIASLFDPEVAFTNDEPLPRPLLNADLSRLPSLVLNKQGEVEGADQPSFVDNLAKLVAHGALRII